MSPSGWPARLPGPSLTKLASLHSSPVDEASVDSDIVEDVRLTIYRGLAHTGRLPSLPDLLAVAGGSERLDECIERLAAARSLVLDAEGDIVLAHPFATRSFGFSVMSAQNLWWGGCAWGRVGCRISSIAGRCWWPHAALPVGNRSHGLWGATSLLPGAKLRISWSRFPTFGMTSFIHAPTNSSSARTDASIGGWPAGANRRATG